MQGRTSPALEERDRLRGETLAPPGEAETVGRRRPDVHFPLADRLLEQPPHLVAVRSDPRLLADEDAVGVHEPPAGSPHLRVGDPQQLDRGNAAVALLTGGEEPADVAETRNDLPTLNTTSAIASSS